MKPLVSVIINNYNYDRFLTEAINSVLNQTYPFVEIVVVDDGSTDRSKEIISSYGNRVISVLKQNGGQASALNEGIKISSGELIFFLDSDDIFLPTKIEEMVELFEQLANNKETEIIISNYINTINEYGEEVNVNVLEKLSTTCAWEYLPKIRGKTSKLIDGVITRLSTSEQVYQFVCKYRFIPYLGMPTSGLAITKALASKVFPIPSEMVKVSADDFIVKGASILGSVYLTNKVLTKYRIHGSNSWYGSQNKIKEEFFEILDDFLNDHLRNLSKKPVFSYFNSMHAKGYYRTHLGNMCYQELFDLSINVITWYVNKTTIVFFVKTFLLSVLLRIKYKNSDIN